MSVGITLPEQILPGLKNLFQLNEEQKKSLYDSLNRAQPFFRDDQFYCQVDHDAMGIDDTYKCSIIQALISLSVGKYSLELPISEFVDGIVFSLLNEPDLCDDFNVSDKDDYTAVLTLFLGLEHSIGAKAKTFLVMTRYERLFTDARILTDFRPVFKTNVTELPTAGVIIHNLQIDYRKNGEQKQFYVALDDQDLNTLAEVLKRAVNKSRSLASLISQTGISFPKDEE